MAERFSGDELRLIAVALGSHRAARRNAVRKRKAKHGGVELTDKMEPFYREIDGLVAKTRRMMAEDGHGPSR